MTTAEIQKELEAARSETRKVKSALTKLTNALIKAKIDVPKTNWKDEPETDGAEGADDNTGD